ncbi:hypothetical protein [Haloprofundus salinisoli]|uniref:hypothetical protein n=1 Tax=Haloprofundus salinisoli TaxID=2876193 RepID=UPI001CCE7440|nr:hypothetical protein [Haloprofundus salinisoli]
MGFEWVAYFECSACGTAERADVIEYDCFGYAVCPACGHETGPLASANANSNVNASADGDSRTAP